MKKEESINVKNQKQHRVEQINAELLSLTFLAERHRKNPEKNIEEIFSILENLKLND